VIEFTVPIPPSTNNLFVNRAGKLHGGRAKGPFYKIWLQEAGWEIKRQRVPLITGIVAVVIDAPLNRRRDLDNALKPLLDLLVRQQVLKDDNLIDDLRIRRSGVGNQVTISIEQMIVKGS
jgi:Holliday junction resolvase RusA-like endonuclease